MATQHKPECGAGGESPWDWMDDCICDNIAAAEQRVRNELST